MNRFALLVSLLLVAGVAAAQNLLSADAVARSFAHREFDQGAFIVREINGKAVCRDATPDEAMRINRRLAPVQVFGENDGDVRAESSAGLHIILRGTAQLDANPAAKAAFQRAAEIWESRIANNVIVYVDVDFGTTRFGEPYEEDVIASASSDYRGGGEDLYAPLRGMLAARSDNAGETALYTLLPLGASIPTDVGPTTRVASPSINLRALGAISAVADPGDSAPTIGFNSAFAYDFDPSDGITAGQKDFEGVVVHEIGHMLGFVSRAGSMEIGSSINAPTVMDFFRFRPGVTNGTFQAADRVQSSGGEQVYFGGGTALAMSTGRPDATGGDLRQASHWKDDALTGTRIGIMDPTLSSSVRSELTDNDIAALNVIGYNMVAPNSGCSESEPNETAANADDLALPGSCGGAAAFNDSSSYVVQYTSTTDGIEDIWKVNLASSAKLHVNLTFSTGDLDVFLFSISGSTLTILGSSNGETNNEDFTTTSTLAPGTYFIGVSAYTGSSSYTVSANAVGGSPVTVNAPTNLVAAATSTSVIHLTWNDNSTNEEEFRVEQKTGASFTDIGAASANATSINVTALNPGQTATFRVRARAGTTYSNYSNEAMATTNAQPGACTPSSTVVCLLSNRFRVKIDYVNPFSNPPNQPGTFLAARLLSTPSANPDTGLFGFDSAQAVEVVVRVQDTRPFAPRFDIYYGGMTDVEYTITVTDTQTGATRSYHNNAGTVGGGVDRTSFPAN
jgi:hypothetical protein